MISHLEKTEEGPFLYRADVLSCAECAAEIFGLDPREIYTFAGMTKQVINLVHASLMEEHADEIRNFGRVLDRGLSLELLLSLIHISEPTRLGMISYAVFCLKKKKIQISEPTRRTPTSYAVFGLKKKNQNGTLWRRL